MNEEIETLVTFVKDMYCEACDKVLEHQVSKTKKTHTINITNENIERIYYFAECPECEHGEEYEEDDF